MSPYREQAIVLDDYQPKPKPKFRVICKTVPRKTGSRYYTDLVYKVQKRFLFFWVTIEKCNRKDEALDIANDLITQGLDKRNYSKVIWNDIEGEIKEAK